MASKLDDTTETGTRGLPRPQSKIAPPTARCCTSSKSAAKARRKVVLRARSGNGHLRPGHRTAEPGRPWADSPLKTSAALRAATAAQSGAAIGPKYAM